MEKQLRYDQNHLANIKALIQEETGVSFQGRRRGGQTLVRKVGFAAACMVCMLATAAFTYDKLSGLKGDELAFSAAYQGDGRFDVVITNLSDRPLELEKKVRVMQWSTSDSVEGDASKILMQGGKVAPHSTEVVHLDLSKGYDVGKMEEELPEGDWYYFVLTNDHFLFGQDWMCSFDFREKSAEQVEKEQLELIDRINQREEALDGVQDDARGNVQDDARGNIQDDAQGNTREDARGIALACEEWTQPVDVMRVSGSFPDHIVLAGAEGDAIYAIADGTVHEVGFDAREGNYVTLDLGEGILVRFGHLKEVYVAEGDAVKRSDRIADMGKTGMATGACLSLTVTANGEYMSLFAGEE